MRFPKFKYLFQNRALVLMYHRISTPVTDPWNLSVSPGNFEAQLNYLREHYSIISIHQLIQQIESGKIRNGSVALTFDDGYLDNFTTAKPLLEKYSAPATFFITDDYLGGQPFWWDELESIIVQTENLPQVFSISFGENTIHFDLGEEGQLTEPLRLTHNNYKSGKPPTQRTKLYVKLWKVFSSLIKEDQMKLMRLIRDWANLTENKTEAGGTMSVSNLKQLSDSPLFTIGGHTSTHPSLSDFPAQIQETEISDNRDTLERITSDKVKYFAYPSGRYNQETIKILKELSFSGAFTTHSGFVSKNTDKYTIPRLQVCDWNMNTFKNKLRSCFRK